MRVVVTGAAGFIGGHVARALAEAGHEVRGVDRRGDPPLDLARDDLTELAEADVVVHLAGRPGVRSSFGALAEVERDNVTATRRLLAACAPGRPRIVLASSSSVYGSATAGPQRESDPLRPASPYARSKAEAERLALRSGLPVTVLRYFSVYGPGQRPDMAFHRFVEAALDGRPLPVFGDGRQARAFTYVGDAAQATVRAVTVDLPSGTVLNIGHERAVPVNAAIALLGELLGVEPRLAHRPPAPGDATRTCADPAKAAALLGWRATTPLEDGLAAQIAWHRTPAAVP